MQENWKIKLIYYVIFLQYRCIVILLVMDVFDTLIFTAVESSEI